MYFRSLDFYFKYTLIRCKLVGELITNNEFHRMAKYREIDFAYCGMAVELEGMKGFIIGHNSSANLDVFFIKGKYKGQILNCHPHYKMTYYDRHNNVIKKFN